MAEAQPKMVKRVVAHKGHYVRDENGEMRYAQPGEVIEVDIESATAHKDRLLDPNVVKAQAEAAAAALAALNDDGDDGDGDDGKGEKPPAKPAANKTATKPATKG